MFLMNSSSKGILINVFKTKYYLRFGKNITFSKNGWPQLTLTKALTRMEIFTRIFHRMYC